jgi:hypothetical protein
MELVIQEALVGLIVAACAIFSAWRLMSPALRLRTLNFVEPVMTRLGATGPVARLRSKVVGQLAAGCSACSHHKTAVHRPRPNRG